MEEDNSNDVVFIDNTDDEDSRPYNSANSVDGSETRPLMQLFERLISNDSKSNTVLTNAQIISILQKEFDIDVTTLHELEVDIYINIIKKFLKDWPQWNAFDRIINKKKKNAPQLKDVLEDKYKDLKDYLQCMIDTAKPLAAEAIQSLKKDETKVDCDNNIVLEVHCTRKQLNQFIFNKPNPVENGSLFNIVNYADYKLNPSLPHYKIESMLHWYGVRLSIDLKSLSYTRYTTHRLSHTLINELNVAKDINKTFDKSVHMKQSKVNTEIVPIATIKSILDYILQLYDTKIEFDMLKAIFGVIKNDLSIQSKTIEVPGTYKHYLSKHPYVRKLYTPVPHNPSNSKYNIYVEETIIPMQDWFIGKVSKMHMRDVPCLQSWLKFECGECKQKFNGAEFLTQLRDHFKVYHYDEMDWSCTNCEKTFKMQDLTAMGWLHHCEKSKD